MTHPVMKSLGYRKFTTVIALLTCLVNVHHAQDSGEESAETEVYQLSAFVINTDADSGYIAASSLAGGRINTPIKFTPSSISSMTEAFLDDLGIQNVREALRWAPNVVPSDPNAGKGFGGSAFHDWSFNYRGAGAGQQGGPGPTRNYFSFYQNADSYNVERIEFLRGPNSLIFGLGTVGGTLSTYTKIPRLDRDFFRPTVTVDSEGSNRYELDFNHRINDKVAVRVNAVVDNNVGWMNNDEKDFDAITLAMLYRPTLRTTIRVEGEYATRENTLFGWSIADKSSGWDGRTASETWGATPTGSSRWVPIQNAGAWGDWLHTFPVFIPGLGANQLMPWAGGFASTNAMEDIGNGLPWAPYAGFYQAEIKLPWHSNYSSTAKVPVMPQRSWTYGNGVNDLRYHTFSAFLDHSFNDNFEISASIYSYDDNQVAKNYEGTGGAAVDINKQLPNGAANPNFGKLFADFFLSKQRQSRSVEEARVQMNYRFNRTLFGKDWEQLFSMSTSTKKVNISARQNLAQIANSTTITNPMDWVQNMVWGRIYLDNPNPVLDIPEVAPNGQIITYSPKADGYWFDFDDEFTLTDFAFVTHSRLLDERLSVIGGFRVDSYDEDIRELRRGPNLTDRFSSESESGTTYSLGAIYYVGFVGFFANYSENIQPPNPGSQPDLWGDRPSPEKGEGMDIGIRVSTADGKYYASLSRYDSKSRGHLVENPIGLRSIWQRYYDANPGLARDPSKNDIAYSDSTSRDVQGWEFEITANPTEQIRLQASFALPEAQVVDFYPGARKYFADNLATWQAGINTAATPQSATDLQSAMNGVQNSLNNSTAGSDQLGVVDYTASLFVHYTLSDDLVKGLSVGMGATRTGKTYIGNFGDKRLYGSELNSMNAMIAWEGQVFRIPARFALNIENLLDEEDPVITGYHWGYADRNGGPVATGFYLPTPRMFRLSARFEF